MEKILRINARDNLIVALKDLHRGETFYLEDLEVTLFTDVQVKHKFTSEDISKGDLLYMYGVPVGQAIQALKKGEAVTIENVREYATRIEESPSSNYSWKAPNVSDYADRSFNGYLRKDGRAGTANYWLVMPMVFCANYNAHKMASALNRALGYTDETLNNLALKLVGNGKARRPDRVFSNIDGIHSISVTGGCGGSVDECETQGRLLAAYADHPNVGGITMFALGCETLQIDYFNKALYKRNPNFDKPILFFRQQDWCSETKMMADAISDTCQMLPSLNECRRTKLPLSKLKIGLTCGGSDGFSGVSANPAIGLISDWVVALGGASALAEFPELCGAESDLVRRCVNPEDGKRFLEFMRNYEKNANFCGAPIVDNLSWGNIKGGLITSAIKSAGAIRKSGRAPVSAVLDYAEAMPDDGLSLCCTPENNLLAVTGQVAAGCNLILFSTGLGTPTGNPIVPVVKLSTNTETAFRLSYMIDFNCGTIIDGRPLEKVAADIFEMVIASASGDYKVKADKMEQHDFMLW